MATVLEMCMIVIVLLNSTPTVAYAAYAAYQRIPTNFNLIEKRRQRYDGGMIKDLMNSTVTEYTDDYFTTDIQTIYLG